MASHFIHTSGTLHAPFTKRKLFLRRHIALVEGKPQADYFEGKLKEEFRLWAASVSGCLPGSSYVQTGPTAAALRAAEHENLS